MRLSMVVALLALMAAADGAEPVCEGTGCPTAQPAVQPAPASLPIVPMQYRRMGTTGLQVRPHLVLLVPHHFHSYEPCGLWFPRQVSVLGYGAWVTFGPQVKEDAAFELMKAAYLRGVNVRPTRRN